MKLTNAQLLSLAKAMEIYVKSDQKKDIIIERIVEGAVGGKLRMRALGYLK